MAAAAAAYRCNAAARGRGSGDDRSSGVRLQLNQRVYSNVPQTTRHDTDTLSVWRITSEGLVHPDPPSCLLLDLEIQLDFLLPLRTLLAIVRSHCAHVLVGCCRKRCPRIAHLDRGVRRVDRRHFHVNYSDQGIGNYVDILHPSTRHIEDRVLPHRMMLAVLHREHRAL